MGFGENLRKLRDARGWSENELYRRSGVSQGVINRLENEPNPNPKMHTLINLAKGLEVSLDTLVGDSEPSALVDRIESMERRISDLERERERDARRE
jgi:transcriptional regulator with XRE-family HTH domain